MRVKRLKICLDYGKIDSVACVVRNILCRSRKVRFHGRIQSKKRRM